MNNNIRNIVGYSFTETVINPSALIFILLMGILTLVLPRRKAGIPLLATACYVTFMQRVVVAGLNFDMLRFILLFALTRIFVRSEYRFLRLTVIDKAIAFYVVSSVISYSILMHTYDAFINRAGFAFNAFGLYFFFRCIMRDFDDIIYTVKALGILMVPLALEMTYEHVSGKNMFSFLGGVPDSPVVRGGRLRAQGAFAHPILAGTLGATMLPIFVGLWKQGKPYKNVAVAGLVASTIIAFTPSSSGPVLAFGAGLVGLWMWRVRMSMRAVRWSVFLLLVALHLYMNGPVWALVWRLSVFDGSTGYFRFALIDQAIRRVGEWWLVGTTNMAYWGWGLQDVTNHYIRVAVDGGLLTLILFVTVIVLSFKAVGRKVRTLGGQPKTQYFVWAMGVSLFCHTVSFMGVSYFDQIVVFWYMSLAMISTISMPDLSSASNTGAARMRRSY